MMDETLLVETPYGFIRGCMEVERFHCDKKIGVIIELKTQKESVQVRATPSGLLRVSEIKKKGK